MKLKKVTVVIAAAAIWFSMLLLPPANASAIKIVIDGEALQTDQPPVAINGSVFVPLRGIFEALDAAVYWNQKEQTVRAVKNDVTIVLKIGAKYAAINNKKVALDSYARAINGRTMVPIRFVSESLGEKVEWSKKQQSVLITTLSRQVEAVQYVTVTADDRFGDGRDWEVDFVPVSPQNAVVEYRILIVKEQAAASFNVRRAQAVKPANYTRVAPAAAGKAVSLSANVRDSDGEKLSADHNYRVFVLTAGRQQFALSSPSGIASLTDMRETVSEVVLRDIGDYGDGRDLSVSFTAASNEKQIAQYRVMIVKTKDAQQFDLKMANTLPSSLYYTAAKSGNRTQTVQLGANARDVSGELIRNGVSYTAFVLAVTNKEQQDNRLSAGSASVTMDHYSRMAPQVTSVADIGNYGDGRDLFVSFNKADSEANVDHYRLFVVREEQYGKFDVLAASKLASDRYTKVSKTGYSQQHSFAHDAKDTDGKRIMNGVGYRVYVMAVAVSHSVHPDLLSPPSIPVSLSAGETNTPVIVNVSDISDYGNGRDLQITFNRGQDERSIDHYRVFVVRSEEANRFSLHNANAIRSGLYTKVSKNGTNRTAALSSTAKDVTGETIRNGIRYRLFVMAVSSTGKENDNLLSGYSQEIMLTDRAGNTAATNLQVADVSDFNDGRDLLVAFQKAIDEQYVNHYRILVVKSKAAGRFKLADAVALQNPNAYYMAAKRGGPISTILSSQSRDTDGDLIRSNEKYKVFVLTIGEGLYAGTNVLSAASSEIELKQTNAADPPSQVKVAVWGNKADGSDVEVSFKRSEREENVNDYRILIVPEERSRSFDMTAAISAMSYGYATKVEKSGSTLTQRLTVTTLDSQGQIVGFRQGSGGKQAYRAFVLAVAKDNTMHALSAPSSIFYLKSKTTKG